MAEETNSTNVPAQQPAPGAANDAQQDKPAAADQTPASDTQQQDNAPLTWDGWLTEQPEPVKTLITEHTAGLKSALDNERQQRKDFEKQVKALSQKAEEGSELRTSLDNLSSAVEQANARADFFEAASDPSLGLRDAKLAWTIISSDPDEFMRRGKPDFDALKQVHPILFEEPRKSAGVPSNAGRGTGSAVPAKSANELMNEFIRNGRG